MSIKKRIYLDYAAATPVCREAERAFVRGLKESGNPSALHHEGVAAAMLLEEARVKVAKLLEVKPHDIRFVSGGTEANNLALVGVVRALLARTKKVRVVTSSIEHPSVLEPLRALKREGHIVLCIVHPNAEGRITDAALNEALSEETHVVSIGIANSEIGAMQTIRSLVRTLKKKYPQALFHTDAGQVHLFEHALPHALGVDLLSLDSGKLYGLRGVGALFVRQGTPLSPILFGGSQEAGVRPGTENVALAYGFGVACDVVLKKRKKEIARMRALQKKLREACVQEGGVINTPSVSLPHILNVSFPHIDPEYFVAYLDARGIAFSTKSACLEKAGHKESHVVARLCAQNDAWRAYSSVRFSFGSATTKKDIEMLIRLLPQALVASVRA